MEGFKTSFLGFDKKSVTAFTKELSHRYAKELKEKDMEISALKAEIKELKQRLKETENGTDK